VELNSWSRDYRSRTVTGTLISLNPGIILVLYAAGGETTHIDSRDYYDYYDYDYYYYMLFMKPTSLSVAYFNICNQIALLLNCRRKNKYRKSTPILEQTHAFANRYTLTSVRAHMHTHTHTHTHKRPLPW